MTRPFFKQLLKDLKERPTDYQISKLTLIDSKTKAEYWIWGGMAFYESWLPRQKFTILEKIRFGWATRDILINYKTILKDLEAAEKRAALIELNNIFRKGE